MLKGKVKCVKKNDDHGVEIEDSTESPTYADWEVVE